MVANNELVRLDRQGWLSGFDNLLRKENGTWWGSRRWLVQSLVWTLIVSGFVASTLFVMPLLVAATVPDEAQSFDPIASGVQALFQIAAVALGAGAIILVQDQIVGERQTGVAEWILAKPVSRPAYFLSKLVAHSAAILIVLVGLQVVIGYALLSLASGEPFAVGPYLVAAVGLAIHTLFYVILTLMLGVLTENRTRLLGISLGVLLGGLVFLNLMGDLALFTPWALVFALPATALGVQLPLSVWVPVGITAALSFLFVALSLWKLERIEF